jgi:23S rRNA pseudouridine2605 synthase
MEIRLQKILAQAGYGSRRHCETLISEERVTVNGVLATLGMKADPKTDSIYVDDIPIREQEQKRYILLNKPRGVLSTVRTPDQRPTVRSLVDLPGHLYPVGRLDLDSEGLILLTNDGVLTHQLTHPSFEHEKEYQVEVKPLPGESQLASWRKGIILDDGTLTQPAKVWIEDQNSEGAWLRVILKEGKNRQIRRMAECSDLQVLQLIRVRIANLVLGDLLPGKWRELDQIEINELKRLITD